MAIVDPAVHALDLTVRPWATRLCQPMLNVEIGTDALKRLAAKEHLLGTHLFDLGSCPSLRARAELDECLVSG